MKPFQQSAAKCDQTVGYDEVKLFGMKPRGHSPRYLKLFGAVRRSSKSSPGIARGLLEKVRKDFTVFYATLPFLKITIFT